ncbi:MAG: hypothetical protein O3A00_15775 [Planctomycetota bacterium]|nr:hypothetical protein [Planctomycetota bacterium]
MTHEHQPRRFDPYHKWLGIAPADQPPNHYRLLGVDVFEDDPEVIEAAADRQMSYIQQCAAGEYLQQSQAILNELSIARVELLNPRSKDAYDAKLRAKHQPPATATPQTPVIHAAPAKPRTRHRRSSMPLFVGICVVLGGVGLLAWQFLGGDEQAQTDESDRTSQVALQRKSRKSNSSSQSTDSKTEERIVVAKTNETTPSKTSAQDPPSGKTIPSPAPKIPKLDDPSKRTVYQLAEIALKITQRRQAEDDFVSGVNVYVDSMDRNDRVRAFQKLAKAYPADEDLFLLAKNTVLMARVDGDVAYVSLTYCLTHFPKRPECIQLASHAAAESTSSNAQNAAMKYLLGNAPADDPNTASIAKQVLRSQAHRDAHEMALQFLLASFQTDPELPDLALAYAKLEPGVRGLPALSFLAANAPKNPAVVAMMRKHAEDATTHRHVKELAVKFLSTLSIDSPTIARPMTLVVAVERAEVPDPESVRAARAEIRQVFVNDVKAAKTPGAKTALANRLATESGTERNPATRYGLLLEAHDLAVENGDTAQVLSVIEKMNELFKIDVTAQKLASLQAVEKSIKSRDVLRSFLNLLAEEARIAVESEQFDAAAKLLDTATTAARKLRDASLSRVLAGSRTELKERRLEFADYQRALGTLENTPRDPEALMIAAKYFCVRKGDWDEGLKRLSTADDAELLQLLARHSTGATEAAVQAKLADDWWAWIRADRRKTRDWLRPIPASWYAKAMVSVAGLERTRIEKRLQEIGSILDGRMASTRSAIEANRRAALWALNIGGQIKIRIAQAEIDVVLVNALPPVQFAVTGVRTNHQPVGDIDLINLTGLSELKTLDLTDSQIVGDGLAHLRQSQKLESLMLDNAVTCTDKALPHIGVFRELKHLHLAGTAIRGRGFEFVQRLTKLETVDLRGVPLTSKQLVYFAGLVQLKELVLTQSKVDSRGFRNLNQLVQLERLELNETELVDADLQIIGTFVKLRHLAIGGCPNLTDPGLESLKTLQSLERLNLTQSQFTDQGLMLLAGLKHLKEIEVLDSQITEAGLERFRELQAAQ